MICDVNGWRLEVEAREAGCAYHFVNMLAGSSNAIYHKIKRKSAKSRCVIVETLCSYIADIEHAEQQVVVVSAQSQILLEPGDLGIACKVDDLSAMNYSKRVALVYLPMLARSIKANRY